MAEAKKYKILIVDDDKFLLGMYTIKFEKEGFEVLTAGSGADAWTKLQEGLAPDIIILDIVMPLMDGLELLTKIRQNHLVPETLIIILSNQGQSSDIEKAKKLGVDGYIVKATTIPSEVLAEVKKALQEHHK
jgi:DNA-binding response OmpR family regulator